MIRQLAHPSVPSAFLSYETPRGTLDAIALPRALDMLNLPTNHALAASASAGPELDLGGFNTLVGSLLEAHKAEHSAATALQAAHRGRTARDLAKANKKQRKKAKGSQHSGDLDSSAIVDHVSGLGVSASGSLALLELSATSLQLHALSGVHAYPALTSVDVSGNALRSLSALAALPHLSRLVVALPVAGGFAAPESAPADLRDNVIVNHPARQGRQPAAEGEGEMDAAAAALQLAARAALEQLPPVEASDTEVAAPAAPAAEASAPGADSVAGVANHPLLRHLLLDNNRIGALTGVEALTNLQTLSAHGNLIRDASALHGLKQLRALDLGRNRLGHARGPSPPAGQQPTGGGAPAAPADGGAAAGGGAAGAADAADAAARLAFLPSLDALQTLCLSHNGLCGLPPLGALPVLSQVDVAHNRLADAPALCDALRGAAAAPLRSLDVAANAGLMRVDDLRLRLLHRLPTLTSLDGAAAAPRGERGHSHSARERGGGAPTVASPPHGPSRGSSGAVSALEKIAAHNLHGEDAPKLEAIRRRHMHAEPPSFSAKSDYPGMHYPSLSMPEMPVLLEAYKAQYTAAFSRLQVGGAARKE